ncbi:MAG: hypothetical protein HYW26_04535 [Candidatus Aenigmarchaeota archaeon]|nr:hypothetical protein [Candidatus Aenigmarchaeota archaeon]
MKYENAIIFALIPALFIAGCVQQSQPKGLGDYTPPTGTPSLEMLSPKDGDVINGSAVAIKVNVTNFRLADIAANRANRDNEGHIHYYLDDREQRVPYTIVSFTNVPAGEHSIRIELHNNDHSPLFPPVTVSIRIRTTG